MEPPSTVRVASTPNSDTDVDSDHELQENRKGTELLLGSGSMLRSSRRPMKNKAVILRIFWASAIVCFLVVSVSTFLALSSDRSMETAVSEAKGDQLTPTEGIPDKTDPNLALGLDLEEEDRPLVLYAYAETENAHQNARFFLQHGLHAEADFIFILNGETTLYDDIPAEPNIKVIQRNNTCFDLGAHAEVLTKNDNELMKKYKRFILMNASIRGPFLPTWSRECWTDAWLDKVTDTTKLVGMAFNCIPTHHVQSMIFATDRAGLTRLLSKINICFSTLWSAVKAEMGCTAAVIDAGYKVKAFMTAFASDKEYVTNCKHGDLLYEDGYYGTTMHPYETMFQKANRNLAPKQLELLTKWHNESGYSSWDVCRRASTVKRALRTMKKQGYDLDFGL
ncbi:hypothetical protein TWF281_004802 [Arthrobotrys megalospora]